MWRCCSRRSRAGERSTAGTAADPWSAGTGCRRAGRPRSRRRGCRPARCTAPAPGPARRRLARLGELGRQAVLGQVAEVRHEDDVVGGPLLDQILEARGQRRGVATVGVEQVLRVRYDGQREPRVVRIARTPRSRARGAGGRGGGGAVLPEAAAGRGGPAPSAPTPSAPTPAAPACSNRRRLVPSSSVIRRSGRSSLPPQVVDNEGTLERARSGPTVNSRRTTRNLGR